MKITYTWLGSPVPDYTVKVHSKMDLAVKDANGNENVNHMDGQSPSGFLASNYTGMSSDSFTPAPPPNVIPDDHPDDPVDPTHPPKPDDHDDDEEEYVDTYDYYSYYNDSLTHEGRTLDVQPKITFDVDLSTLASKGMFDDYSTADYLSISQSTGSEGADFEDFSNAADSDWPMGTNGTVPWHVWHNAWGGAALKSGTIGDGETSSYVKTTNANAYSFNWQVSSEPDYDFFRFYIDGEKIFEKSDKASGQQFGDLRPGEHTFEFVYSKDSSGSTNQDAAWIDNLFFQDGSNELMYEGTTTFTDGSAITFVTQRTIPGATLTAKGTSFEISINQSVLTVANSGTYPLLVIGTKDGVQKFLSTTVELNVIEGTEATLLLSTPATA
jgi:hypothetical protein